MFFRPRRSKIALCQLGTCFIAEGNRLLAIADLIEAAGGHVGENEMILVANGDPMPFHWEFNDVPPQPVGFVLAFSGTTLDDVYAAVDWEDKNPSLPAPTVFGDRLVQHLPGTAKSEILSNGLRKVAHIYMR